MSKTLLTVLATDPAEATLARSLLKEDPAIERHGSYLYVRADAAAARLLRDRGILAHAEQLAQPAGEPITPAAGQTAKLRLEGPLSDEKVDWLAQNGVTLVRRLGSADYLARTSKPRDAGDPAWLQWFAYGPGDRLHKELAQQVDAFQQAVDDVQVIALGADDAAPADDEEEREYDLVCLDRAQLPALRDELAADPRLSVRAGATRLRVAIRGQATAAGVLAQLRADPRIDHIEDFVPPEPQLSFAWAAVLGDMPRAALPGQGEGEVLGIADTGVDAEHPDLQGRVEVVLLTPPLSERDPHGHGTHVASIAAGDGKASDGQLAGIAPKARLFFQSLADAELKLKLGVGLVAMLQEAFDKGVRVQNYSWGSAVRSRFTLDSEDIDEFVHGHEDMLVVVSCGNAGIQSSREEDPPNVGLGSLTSPALAKNAIAVGATCSPRPDGPYADRSWKQFDGVNPPSRPPLSDLRLTGDATVVAPLSSRGPCDDGRVKPDLLAPGIGIAAACSAECHANHPLEGNDKYRFASGTSMAAPVVSGAAVLLREFFVKQHGHQPSAALLKACLVNAAQWLPGELWSDERVGEPNFHQGYGLLRLDRLFPRAETGFGLLFADVRNASEQALRARQQDNGPQWRRKLQVEAGTPLAITMAWTDPPARHIQHQLDLVVKAPSGAKHVGNPRLQRLAFEGFDSKNNVEKVWFDVPEAGEWTIEIYARNTFRGPQGFALAATGKVAGAW